MPRRCTSSAPLGASVDETAYLARRRVRRRAHLIGVQRRLAPGARSLRALLAGGYVGKVHSVTLHVTTLHLGARLAQGNAHAADVKNGASALSIPTAHWLDTVLAALGGGSLGFLRTGAGA